LGRRIAKTVDGVTVGYVLNLVGGMERTLCDLDATGNVTAWYVHGPDLCYRVDSANNVVCYHADAMANVITLTGPAGTNLAQYAYTPYGRSLGSTNLQPSAFGPQPFLFVGSQGVMEELPGLYFMRARYYSADAGVFLSTEPRKHIGPMSRPVAYAYGINNPLAGIDPNGKSFISFIANVANSLVQTVTQGLQSLTSFAQQVVTVVGNAGAKAAAAVAGTRTSVAGSPPSSDKGPAQTPQSGILTQGSGGGSSSTDLGNRVLQSGSGRGGASFLERAIAHTSVNAAKTATENYVLTLLSGYLTGRVRFYSIFTGLPLR
jgi:RHS repeat-associated protein